MPTGSYKDRGVSVMVNWLSGLGYEVLVDDSSGNAGASLACYAGRAGLRSCIFVPLSAPEPKKAQISVYGGELVEVPGPRSEATKAAEAVTSNSRDMAYASHAWHPAFLLGQMTVAWEIWEQLGGVVPDWLVAPTGHGGTLLGAWRGFQHLRESGITTKLPRLIAVQAEPYTPLYDAFVNGWERVQATAHVEKISADGIAISYPVRSVALLEAIRFSKGIVLAIAEHEVVAAHHELAARGLFVEPTSATVGAALRKLPAGFIKPKETRGRRPHRPRPQESPETGLTPMMGPDPGPLQPLLGLQFTDETLLRRAFVHRSYLNELADDQAALKDNERLEFLGDVVLSYIVSEHLFRPVPRAAGR